MLDEVHRLATSAPIDELIHRRLDYVNRVLETYPRDAIAWQGVGRLADATLATPDIPNRRVFARWLAQVIANADPGLTRTFVDRVPALRALE